ncbi:MAG: pyruvate kinase [Patescibacteria group bacterium]
MMRKQVKIVATLGPASDNKIMIKKLAQAGVNVFRLNLSHRTEEECVQTIAWIRSVGKELNTQLAVLGDLAGPKIRIGMVEPPLELHSGQTVSLVSKKVNGTLDGGINLNFPDILKRLEKGMEIYLDDGLLKFQVLEKTKEGVKARVLIGGLLKSRKGFSVQGLSMGRFQLSQKDKTDIKAMVKLGADFLAVSFVQDARDIEAVKVLLPKNGSRPQVIAKIETADAVREVDGILEAADGLMIARGDLGLSVPMPEIPFIQKELIIKCMAHAKPVITATQMLESMIHNPLPTRAEVTDVTKAILDGSDAVMLSGETAAGKFPEEAVRTMADIIKTSTPKIVRRIFSDNNHTADAVAASACSIADQVAAKLIIVFTETGSTARRISRHRHQQPITALTTSVATLHQLSVTWGVTTFLEKPIKTFDEAMPLAHRVAVTQGLKKGELFVVSAGVPFGTRGSTNLIFIGRV